MVPGVGGSSPLNHPTLQEPRSNPRLSAWRADLLALSLAPALAPFSTVRALGLEVGLDGVADNLLEDVVLARVDGLEPLDRALLRAPAAFAIDDQGVVDLTGVDHRRRELHAVDEAEAGVREVEVEARGRLVDEIRAKGNPEGGGVDRCGESD